MSNYPLQPLDSQNIQIVPELSLKMNLRNVVSELGYSPMEGNVRWIFNMADGDECNR